MTDKTYHHAVHAVRTLTGWSVCLSVCLYAFFLSFYPHLLHFHNNEKSNPVLTLVRTRKNRYSYGHECLLNKGNSCDPSENKLYAVQFHHLPRGAHHLAIRSHACRIDSFLHRT